MTIEASADIRRKETAEWFARLSQRRVTSEDVRAFSAWRRDPENARAFDRMQAMWEAAGTLAHHPDMADLSREVLKQKVERPRPAARSLGRLSPLGAAGLTALVVALATGGGVLTWSLMQPPAYATAVGEQRVVRLADGSRVTLDTASRVTVRLTDARREVVLVQGQARFEVEGDPSRPFVVRAGETEVTALGTRFDVRRFGAGARIVLVEGRVAVSDRTEPKSRWSLTPGQTILTATSRPKVEPADVPAATSWSSGRLTFDNTPLGLAVAEMNRYAAKPIELDDARISTVRVSGVFNAGDIDGFAAALQDLYPLHAERMGDGRLRLAGADPK